MLKWRYFDNTGYLDSRIHVYEGKLEHYVADLVTAMRDSVLDEIKITKDKYLPSDNEEKQEGLNEIESYLIVKRKDTLFKKLLVWETEDEKKGDKGKKVSDCITYLRIEDKDDVEELNSVFGKDYMFYFEESDKKEKVKYWGSNSLNLNSPVFFIGEFSL